MTLYVINFKAYSETIGERGLRVAKELENFSKEAGAEIMVAVQPTDIRMISREVSIPVLAQSFDPVEPGARTGHLTLNAAVDAGVRGTLLNHSEHRIPVELIETGIKMAKNAGKLVIVCARDAHEVKELSQLGPDYIAIEPPELIGGDVCVCNARPEVISDSVNVSEVPVLAGAGIKTSEDVKKSLELGAVGVLVASGIAKAGDVRKAIEGLVVR